MLSIQNNILIYEGNQIDLDGEIPTKILNPKYIITEANHIYEISDSLHGLVAIRILTSHNINCVFAFNKYNFDTIIIQNTNGDVYILKHNYRHMYLMRNISQKIINADIYKNTFVKLETKDYYYFVLFTPDQVIWEQLPKLMQD